ncbi:MULTISPECIES: HPP family protein [Halolamina]|uniref:HPP family protein n=1 Tax=Halolamina pelagica TaxID=699431 RepID=A0A1I5PSE6_9EURY|nr:MULTISPECIES: HPP family protein [Halolamina]NHX34932.1 HPP family protein [Halolamina sp. R1-12]SFP36913.1 HPP family protein [Halolamina pelagica]
MDGSVEAGARAGALLAATGVAAVLTGSPFLFPSLGPSAYLLATAPDAPASRPRNVLGGHAVGVVAGLLATHLISPGLVVIEPLPAFSPGMFRLGASAIVSVALTTGGMLATGYEHAPACATTLIVALGLLSTPIEGAIVLAAVLLLVGTDALLPVRA